MLDDDSLMPWGKHKDKVIKTIPPEYFKYLWDNNMCWGPVKDYIILNLSKIKAKILQQTDKAA